MTFRMELISTNAFYCWCCAAINWLTLVLILLTSLVIAVPVIQLSASPKKGRRLLLVHLLKGDIPLKVGSLLRS